MGRKKAEYEWERKKGESSESYAAFKLYYQMGDKRSCAKVAKTWVDRIHLSLVGVVNGTG